MYHFKLWKSNYPTDWFSCIPGKNGFLPVDTPLTTLPDKYNIIESLLKKMKIAEQGYLYHNQLGIEINKLPLLDVSNENDPKIIAALFRDYSFLTSAYSLEETHQSFLVDKKYGKARTFIPKQLAIPLTLLACKLGTQPWINHAYGYCLNNSILKRGSNSRKISSYSSIRTFNGCHNEEEFINIQVAMIAQSGKLLQQQQDILNFIHLDNRDNVDSSLLKHYQMFNGILQILQGMSDHLNNYDYLNFRTFTMGQFNNPQCYPDGEIYFEMENGNTKSYTFRGESTSQDSLIPSIDNLFGIKFPSNALTKHYDDLNEYRPRDHQEYIKYLGYHSDNLELQKYCLQDIKTSLLLLKNLNCLRIFRKKNWNLTKKYIIQNIDHPVETGGTPITTGLPNELVTTIEYMNIIVKKIDDYLPNQNISKEDLDYFIEIKLELNDHLQTIVDEVGYLQRNFINQEHAQFLNRKFNKIS